MAARAHQSGFTLIEAIVAMMIVALVVIEYIGIRTSALIDATEARNWRLAREIAEEKMSELQAGARETPPESGELVPIDRYQGFAYKIVIGESAVADLEAEVAQAGVEDGSEASERLDWQRQRDDYRAARKQGLTAMEYDDRRAEEEYKRRTEDKAPSATEFEEVAVVVYFPKMNADYEGQQDSLLIKAQLSTLALSGLTPTQAETLAASKGESAAPVDGGGGVPDGGRR